MTKKPPTFCPPPSAYYFSPMLFDLYWRTLGLPWSRARGALTDLVPFSLVELTLWIGTAATFLLLFSLFPARRNEKKDGAAKRGFRGVVKTRGVRLAALAAGPVLLIALGLGQGAFPGSLAPTAWRTPLEERLQADDLAEDVFRSWVAAREAALREAFDGASGSGRASWAAFQSLTELETLAACDTGLDVVLASLGLPAGRKVGAFKDMGPWTTAIGLAYGGPAFHDPFFAEIAIVRDADMPAPHFWRLTAACHEAAHAKGFTREMDAEILTQLALVRSGDARLRSLGDIHFLRKAGVAVAWPDSLVAESQRARARRSEVEKKQHVVRALRETARRLGLQNSAGKYGVRGAAEAWNPRHPFFATVRSAARSVETTGVVPQAPEGPRHGSE